MFSVKSVSPINLSPQFQTQSVDDSDFLTVPSLAGNYLVSHFRALLVDSYLQQTILHITYDQGQLYFAFEEARYQLPMDDYHR